VKHQTTVNGVILYELEPTTNDDRHIIEIMKGKTQVKMRQSSKGGIIFELDGAVPEQPIVKADEKEDPTDLSGLARKAKNDLA
jgi:hypothetical protein